MIKNVDMHTHSLFSVDSTEEIDCICRKAIQKGLKAICITDHVDFNPNDYGFNYYRAKEYMNAIEKARLDFKDKIVVLSGIEFSEPHLYKDKLHELHNIDYDVILGSIHWLGDEFVGQKKLLENYPQAVVEEKYYGMVLKSIEAGGFDVLAHLDFPKRYYESSLAESSLLIKILKALIDRDIALEINTSSLRKGHTESMPSIPIIEDYIKLGGRKLTIGSDAHICDDIANDFDSVISQLSEEAINCLGVYKSRRFIPLKEAFEG